MDIINRIEFIINAMRDYVNAIKDKDYLIAADYYDDYDKLAETEYYEKVEDHLINNLDLYENELRLNHKKLDKVIKRSESHAEIDKAFDKVEINLKVKISNRFIDEENEKIDALRKRWKKNIKKLMNVRGLLEKSLIDYDSIKKSIDELDYELEEMNTLKPVITDLLGDIEIYAENKRAAYIEQKEKERLERLIKEKELLDNQPTIEEDNSPEEPNIKIIDINNYELVEQILLDNYELLQPILSLDEFEEIFDIKDFKDMIKWPFNGIHEKDYQDIFSSLLESINNEKNPNSIKLFIEFFLIFINKYDLFIFYRDVVQKSKDICNINNITQQEMDLIMTIQKDLNDLNSAKLSDEDKYAIIDNFNTALDNIYISRKIQKAEDNKTVINGFVLFDYKKDDKNNIVPYILSDLDENNKNNQIDNSLPKDKLKSKGYQDFNNMINDIIEIGEPKALLNLGDKMKSFVRPVYRTSGSHDVINTSSKYATGMLRIRPTKLSLVRFIEERFTLKPGDKNYQIIKELIEDRLSSVVVSDNGFNLYINYLTSFKFKDLDSYNTCIKRYETSLLKKIFSGEELTNDDIEELRNAIDASIDAYSKLQDMNDSFKFDTVNQIVKSSNSKK